MRAAVSLGNFTRQREHQAERYRYVGSTSARWLLYSINVVKRVAERLPIFGNREGCK